MGGRARDRRFKSCQHCYRKVRLMPSDTPGAPDRPFDDRGEPECAPGLLHRVMPVVSEGCLGATCGYPEPHRHGFACDKSCEVCGGR